MLADEVDAARDEPEVDAARVDDDDDQRWLGGSSKEHSDSDETPATKKTSAEFREQQDEDWQATLADLHQRRRTKMEQAAGGRVADPNFMRDEEEMRAERAALGRKFWLVLLAAVIVGGYQAWSWFNPMPVSCSLEVIRPQKFKVDVTELFAPRVSAALSLVLSLKNTNMLRSMLLEECKFTAFELDTGLKLGSVQQGALVLSPLTSTSVTLSLNGLASSLPPPEQRRLAAAFLATKVLQLTIVATCSSRVRAPRLASRACPPPRAQPVPLAPASHPPTPRAAHPPPQISVKGSKSTSVSTNSSRRVDLSALAKEPFFQRQVAPPPEEEEEAVRDVPL